MSMQAVYHSIRSLAIQNSLGTRCAAGFLRNRNVSITDALFVLIGRNIDIVLP